MFEVIQNNVSITNFVNREHWQVNFYTVKSPAH